MKQLIVLLVLSVNTIANAEEFVHKIYVVSRWGMGFGPSDQQIENAHNELEKNCTDIYKGELTGPIYDLRRYSTHPLPIDTHEVYSVGKCRVK